MTKKSLVYRCEQCAAEAPKWAGQCGDCGAWNALSEVGLPAIKITKRRGGYAGAANNTIQSLGAIECHNVTRFTTRDAEFDRVLGGGLVQGAVMLLGGDPGIGKSTLLLQTLCELSQSMKVLYITGEESPEQVSLRAKRLDLPADNVGLCTETNLERILAIADKERPQVMVIDSIQTMYTDTISSAPGGVGQVRETASQLVQFAKQSHIALFLVGHVTKEGALAGPRVLEHMVDTVLYFEGQTDSRYRLIRTIKNRFGAVNEIGLFAMTEKGLRPVSNPSALFLSRDVQDTPGSVVMASWEGTRPILVEVQALVDDSHLPQPRRVTLGLDHNRIAMLLAVLNRHGGIATYDQDVYVNVVGGIRVNEPAVDLAIVSAVLSSLRNRPLPHDLIVFGEVGLAGELRPVSRGQERLREASKHGFKRAIIPSGNRPKLPIDGMDILAVGRLDEALEQLKT